MKIGNWKLKISANLVSVLVLLAVLGFGGYLAARNIKSPTSANSHELENNASQTASKFKLPSGPDTFQIVEAAGKEPQIISATIDPPDVHVGNKQTLSIIVSDPDSIASAEAQIQTDHGTTTLPLNYVRVVQDSEIKPSAYSVDQNGQLVINEKLRDEQMAGKDVIPSGARNLISFLNLGILLRQLADQDGLVGVARGSTPTKLLYQGTWTVADTHDTKYHTTFIVKDVKGNINTITLAWSDACAIPNSGAWSLSSNGANCTISSVDGVDNGSATINTYTLTLNSTFAFNSGQSISITTGHIAIGSGGQILKTYLWKQDADVDGYPAATNMAQATSPGTGWARKYTYGSLADDCNDNNASVNPGQTAYFTSPDSVVGYDYNCDGLISQQYPLMNVCSTAGQTACQNGLAAGWVSSVPSCGTSAAWATCTWSGTSCSVEGGGLGGSTKTQACN